MTREEAQGSQAAAGPHGWGVLSDGISTPLVSKLLDSVFLPGHPSQLCGIQG